MISCRSSHLILKHHSCYLVLNTYTSLSLSFICRIIIWSKFPRQENENIHPQRYPATTRISALHPQKMLQPPLKQLHSIFQMLYVITLNNIIIHTWRYHKRIFWLFLHSNVERRDWLRICTHMQNLLNMNMRSNEITCGTNKSYVAILCQQ